MAFTSQVAHGCEPARGIDRRELGARLTAHALEEAAGVDDAVGERECLHAVVSSRVPREHVAEGVDGSEVAAAERADGIERPADVDGVVGRRDGPDAEVGIGVPCGQEAAGRIDRREADALLAVDRREGAADIDDAVHHRDRSHRAVGLRRPVRIEAAVGAHVREVFLRRRADAQEVAADVPAAAAVGCRCDDAATADDRKAGHARAPARRVERHALARRDADLGEVAAEVGRAIGSCRERPHGVVERERVRLRAGFVRDAAGLRIDTFDLRVVSAAVDETFDVQRRPHIRKHLAIGAQRVLRNVAVRARRQIDVVLAGAVVAPAEVEAAHARIGGQCDAGAAAAASTSATVPSAAARGRHFAVFGVAAAPSASACGDDDGANDGTDEGGPQAAELTLMHGEISLGLCRWINRKPKEKDDTLA